MRQELSLCKLSLIRNEQSHPYDTPYTIVKRLIEDYQYNIHVYRWLVTTVAPSSAQHLRRWDKSLQQNRVKLMKFPVFITFIFESLTITLSMDNNNNNLYKSRI